MRQSILAKYLCYLISSAPEIIISYRFSSSRISWTNRVPKDVWPAIWHPGQKRLKISVCQTRYFNKSASGHWQWRDQYLNKTKFTMVHFINENSQSPPIDWFSMSLIQQYFWRNVLRSAAKSISSGFDNFGESEICQFQIPVGSHQ